jgi:hypothetical protein
MGENLTEETNFIIGKKMIKSREVRRAMRSRGTGTGVNVNETNVQEIANAGTRENFDDQLVEEVNKSPSNAGEKP